MSSNFTLFQSDPSSSTSGNAFDQDAFQDINLAANNNTGLTDTASTNPNGSFFANDDSVRFGAKTLYIKDLVLLADHAKWINGEPTYQIIWNENYPSVQGYLFGNIQINRGKYVSIRQAGDGIGITGVFRKCAFLVTGDTAATATAQLAVDGANTTTVNFGNLSNALVDGGSNPLNEFKYYSFVNSASNATKDIHDYRLTAIQTSTLRIVGVVVYAENSGQNIDIFPGVSYSNKTRVSTTVGATASLPSYAGNLGGRALIYKTQNAGYSLAVQPAPNLTSVATGTTGTNLLTVTTGTGASFPVGSGIAAFWGSTAFIGSITNQSTDTLTVAPTLSFGISGLIYKTWASGSTLAINSSQMVLSSSIDFNQQPFIRGITTFYSEPTGQYRIWGNASGYTIIDSIWPAIVGTNTSLGFLQVDGFFSAADIEFVGQGILHATFTVNGYPAFGINAGQTGAVKKTVFTDAGPQWNSFNISWGASYSNIGINRINLFQRAIPQGISSGLLAQFDTLPTFVNQSAVNASLIALGTYRRHYGDQLAFSGSWHRSDSSNVAAGGVQYESSGSSTALNFNYYGKNFAVIGLSLGASLTMTVDGASFGFTLNTITPVTTEGFHSVVVTNQSGTATISAVDVFRTQGEIKSLQQSSAVNFPSVGASIGYLAAEYGCGSSLILPPNPTNGNPLLSLKFHDNTGGYNGTSGILTVPYPGRWRVGGCIGLASNMSWTSPSSVSIGVYKNGAIWNTVGRYLVTTGLSASSVQIQCTPTIIPCLTNDTLQVQISAGITTVIDTSQSSNNNHILFERVGD